MADPRDAAQHEFVVVGSGPAGTCAADRLLELGKSVTLIDAGDDDPETRSRIPDRSFDELRRSDANQKDYFLGKRREGVPRGRIQVGSHLTPPRQYVRRLADQALETRLEDSSVMQSLAWGGLGGAWGAGLATYTDSELSLMGLDPRAINPRYQEVTERIGASGELGPLVSKLRSIPPALPLDENARSVLAAARRLKEREPARLEGLELGPYALAALSADLGSRGRNPLHDMDFYGEVRRSVFRPRYLLDELAGNPRLKVVRGKIVYRLEKGPDGVTILGLKDLATGATSETRAKVVLLAAGAINSARILMNSSPIAETRTGTTDDQPLLSNPYRYWVMLNRPRFGKRAQGERHSLAQLYGLYRDRPDTLAEVSLSFYSYRSLLLFKLVRELPMPVPFGVLAARLLVDSLVIVGVHERGTEGRMELEAASDAGPASIRIRAPRRSEAVMNERGLLRKLSALGLSSLSVVAPPWGASIHYAGSVPFAGTRPARWTCSRRFEVEGFPGVFLADSSAWGELPAKGLTLTIMAHARALADQVAGR